MLNMCIYTLLQLEPTSPVEELFYTESAPSGQLIHYHQELSRNNLELASLRKQKRELEAALHDLQSNVSLKEQQYDEQVGKWKNSLIFVYLRANVKTCHMLASVKTCRLLASVKTCYMLLSVNIHHWLASVNAMLVVCSGCHSHTYMHVTK